MPTYGKEKFKDSNINYLNKDFTSLKQSLMQYAKSYFPNTYRDFNETSPGMMLIEMNAYVGDVLSFYVDQQYREMLLPLAEERRNIINLAKMFGYKVKPIIPSFVDLTFTSNVATSSGDPSKIDYSTAGIFDEGIEIVSSTNSKLKFRTLEPIDFTITGSGDTENIGTINSNNGIATEYSLTRTVRAISAEQKSKTFSIGAPIKFRRITIPDTNVIDIVSCVDSNGNNWYEVDFLAQDKVPIPLHYTNDSTRGTSYTDENGLEASISVPYSLTYITTPKRFTRETNVDNTTSLIFGNGILNDGQLVDTSYIDLEQVGIVIPGQTNDLNEAIDPLLGDEYSTLGETPNNTTLTITYRVGGGISANVPSADLTTLPSGLVAQNGNTSATLLTVNNQRPARGGRDKENTLEIKEKAKAFFATQNRCVTKEDYEARTLNMSSKFGSIAKAYVAKPLSLQEIGSYDQQLDLVQTDLNTLANYISNTLGSQLNNLFSYAEGSVSDPLIADFNGDGFVNSEDRDLVIEGIQTLTNQLQTSIDGLPPGTTITPTLGAIDIYVLAYNNLKQFVGNPFAGTLGMADNVPTILKNNIRHYLEEFSVMSDVITIRDGYIVNFGVFFDIVAEKFANKQQVKINCIQKIKNYFANEKMQFNQPIYKSQLEFELMGVEGVRSIGHVTITQDYDYFYSEMMGEGYNLPQPTWFYSANNGEFEADGTLMYGYKYDFQTALSEDKTVVLPPVTETPAVFELKFPNRNIQGRVR
tara:strand:+ start:4137 stop:6401 length:2265 start_codon:yes stop_codon:yes gene_type:complete